jgi:hypothetical protein
MTNPPNVTPEMIELLERRLAENVGDRVERTLKVRYAGIVATVLFVLGLAGYSWIESLVVKAIGPVSKDAERTIAEMSWQLDLARETKKKLDALVEQITTDADAAQRRIESFQARLTKQQEEFDTTLASVNDQLGAVVVRRRELEADLQQNRTSVVAGLAATRADVAELARMTAELAELADDDRPELAGRVAELQAEATALIERAQREATGEKLATVFIQYGKSVRPELAQSLAETLKSDGYVVPSEDRMSNDALEVRYFQGQDLEAANALAAKVTTALAALGFPQLDVAVKDLTAWNKARPRTAGTMELWLALPGTKG